MLGGEQRAVGESRVDQRETISSKEMAFGELPVLTVPNSADGPQGTGPAQDLHWLDEQWP